MKKVRTIFALNAVGYALKKTWLIWLVLAAAEYAWQLSMTGWVAPAFARETSGAEAVFIFNHLAFILLVSVGIAAAVFYSLTLICERMSVSEGDKVELQN
jgi:hypothetical protein